MKKINLNKLAREVTLAEGMKKNLTIADVKEVLRITFEFLTNADDFLDVMNDIRRKYKVKK